MFQVIFVLCWLTKLCIFLFILFIWIILNEFKCYLQFKRVILVNYVIIKLALDFSLFWLFLIAFRLLFNKFFNGPLLLTHFLYHINLWILFLLCNFIFILLYRRVLFNSLFYVIILLLYTYIRLLLYYMLWGCRFDILIGCYIFF